MASADLLSLLAGNAHGRRLARAGCVLLVVALGGAAWLSATQRQARGVPAVQPAVPVAAQPPAPPRRAANREAASRREGETLPIAEWLERLAAGAGMGLLVGPGVNGRVSGILPPNLPWRSQLAALARVHGFSYRLGDGVIEVVAASAKPPAPASEAAENAKREPARDEVPPERRSRILFPANARAEDLAELLKELFASEGLRATSDSAANALVLEGAEALVQRAAEMVPTLDLPRRRFLLEAQLIELSSTARDELGVQWSVDGSLGSLIDFPGTTGDGEHGGIVVATTGAHALKAKLNALASEGRVRVVSRPRMIVVDQQQAEIESVRILRIRLPERSAVVEHDGSAAQPGRAVEEIPVGVSLRVEPSLIGDGRVAMHLAAKSSTLGRPQPPDLIPEELSRRFEADVIVASGETAVLGGLLREGRRGEQAGVPLLRSLPVLGVLFGRRSHERQGEELIVLITPSLLE